MEIKNDDGRSYIDIPCNIKAEDITPEGSFKGYGSLFDNKPDAYRDIVSKGAFINTLAKGGRNRSGIPMLWQHQRDQIPGVWKSMVEDDKGLAVEGQFLLKTQLGNEVHEILKMGAELGTFTLGMSIGYDAIKYDIDEKKRVRNLKEVDLWELSLVTFPAKLGTNVTRVKQIEEAGTERELEQGLREAGLSKSAAQYVVKLCRPSLREAQKVNGEDVLLTILNSLKQTNSVIGESFKE